MSSKRKSFIQMCVEGRAQPDDLDRFVERWHKSETTLALHEFLGLSRQEYGWIIEKPELLPVLLFARKTGVPVREVLTFSARQLGLARSKPAASPQRLLQWLDQDRRPRRRASAS